MVHYKLIYFNFRGRGELSRLIFHYAQVPFEDFRIEHSEWPNYKQNTLFGQLPALEIDGEKRLAQSNTIARYLAGQYGLAGKNDWERAQADMYVDCVEDIIIDLGKIMFPAASHDENHGESSRSFLPSFQTLQKYGRVVKYYSNSFQPHLVKIERDLVKNGTGYLVGDSLTWADLAYYSFFGPICQNWFGSALLGKNAPHLKKLFQKIEKIPQIKSYLAVRPKTDL